jgi:DNA-binding GntR family transcriptional regulator
VTARDPRYREIADDLRRDIASGRYPPGSDLPPIRELMNRFQVSVNPLRAAIKVLMDEELVAAQRGRGTRVLRSPTAAALAVDRVGGAAGQGAWAAALTRGGRSGTVRLLSAASERATDRVAARLERPVGAQVIRRQLVALLDDLAAQVINAYYPADRLGPALLVEDVDVAAAMAAAGAGPGSREERVSARGATAEDAGALGIGLGAACLVIETLARDLAGAPVEYVTVIADPGRVELLYPSLPPLQN